MYERKKKKKKKTIFTCQNGLLSYSRKMEIEEDSNAPILDRTHSTI